MDIEYYKLRLNAVDSAATQGRWVSILSTVASIAILGGIWNSLPWGHYAHVQRYWQEGYALDTATADLQKELLKTWVNSLFLNFPVLGVRFSIYDAWIIGSFALIVLAAWEFFALRRENDLIARLLQDASQQNQSTKCFVYHGILGTQLFATISDSSEPIRSIHSPGCTSNGSLSIARWVPRFIMNLPATTIACILISDIVTLLYPAPFRRSHRALWEAMAPIELFFTLVEEIGVLFLGLIMTYLIWRASRFQEGTIGLLREARKENWGDASDESPG